MKIERKCGKRKIVPTDSKKFEQSTFNSTQLVQPPLLPSWVSMISIMASTFALLSFTLIAITTAMPPSPTPTSLPTARSSTTSPTGTTSPETTAATPSSFPPPITISSPPTTPLQNDQEGNDENQHQEQMSTIIDALIGALDFGSWSNVLSSMDPSLIDPSLKTATLFVPDNDTGIRFDPFLVPYHIIPQQRLSFSDLLRHEINTRLPTLLPANSLVITNNSGTNFTIDGVPITTPDLYLSSVISIHGIGTVFDYTLFGNRTHYNSGSSVEQLQIPNPFLPSNPPLVALEPSSVSASWCVELPLVLSVFCSVLAFKIASTTSHH